MMNPVPYTPHKAIGRGGYSSVITTYEVTVASTGRIKRRFKFTDILELNQFVKNQIKNFPENPAPHVEMRLVPKA